MVGDKLAKARFYPPYKVLGKQDKTDLASGLSKLNFSVTELARVSAQKMIRRKSGDCRYGQPDNLISFVDKPLGATEKSQRPESRRVGKVASFSAANATHHLPQMKPSGKL